MTAAALKTRVMACCTSDCFGAAAAISWIGADAGVAWYATGGASTAGRFDVEPQAQSVNARTIKMRVRMEIDLLIDKGVFTGLQDLARWKRKPAGRFVRRAS